MNICNQQSGLWLVLQYLYNHNVILVSYKLITFLSQVLCKDAVDELELDASTEWLEFGFKKYMWRIGLKWEDGNVFFDIQWNTFAKAAKLEVGDKIMLMRDTHWQIFEVAVFEKNCGNLFNNFGKRSKT